MNKFSIILSLFSVFIFTGVVSATTSTVSSSGNMPVCSEIYAPVCAQPPMPECPTGMSCPAVMPPLKTYSSACHAKGNGATVVSQGECRSVPTNGTNPGSTGSTTVPCPVPTFPAPPDGCKYVNDGETVLANGCKFPKLKLVCDEVKCPIMTPPPPKEGCRYENDGETVLANGCKFPKLKLVCDEPSCPATFDPVCAMPPMPVCLSDVVCPQVMPIATTYSNRCEADKAKAKFLYAGECTKDGTNPPTCPQVMPPVTDKPNCKYVANGEKKLSNGCKIPRFVLSCSLSEAEKVRLDKLAASYIATAKRTKQPLRMLQAISTRLSKSNTERSIYLKSVLDKAIKEWK